MSKILKIKIDVWVGISWAQHEHRPGKDTVGVEHVEGLDPGVEELVLARLVAVEFVGNGKLRIEAAGEDQLEHGEVFVGDGPAALQQLPHPPRVVPQPGKETC